MANKSLGGNCEQLITKIPDVSVYVEPNSRCAIYSCRNIFTELEKGQLINTGSKGKARGLDFICNPCFQKRGDVIVDYNEMEPIE